MNFDPVTRARLATSLLVAIALFANARFLYSSLRTHAGVIGNEDITVYETRFDAVKKALPPRGCIGYFWERADWKRWDWHYAQYALAPIILDKNPEHPLVIGNFPDRIIPVVVVTNTKYALVKDFDNGVMLFRNEAK